MEEFLKGILGGKSHLQALIKGIFDDNYQIIEGPDGTPSTILYLVTSPNEDGVPSVSLLWEAPDGEGYAQVNCSLEEGHIDVDHLTTVADKLPLIESNTVAGLLDFFEEQFPDKVTTAHARDRVEEIKEQL